MGMSAEIANLDLLAVGITVAATGVLGFVVFFQSFKSRTNQAFLWFCLVTILWGTVNYLNYQSFFTPEIQLLLLRVTIFLGVWHAFTLYKLLYIFPEDSFYPSNFYSYVIKPAALLVSILTLTPFVFKGFVALDGEGRIIRIENGPGIALFGSVVILLICSAIYILCRKTLRASGVARKQFSSILIGIISTFLLIIIFNFILPAFFDNPRYIALGPVFILPFVIFTSYAIVRHHLLNVKVISTEVLTFLLAVLTSLEVLLARDLLTIIFRTSIFLLVLVFGILLIRGVLNEVRAREEIERLAGALDTANQELKRLDETKSEFISIASHQLRTPLTVIKGYISMILEGTYGKIPAKQQAPLEKVYESGERLIKLIENLLSISRIESGRMKFGFSSVQFVEVAASVADELQAPAKARGLVLKFNSPQKQPPKLQMDTEKIRQVMINLVDNSVKYTQRGTITVAVKFMNEGDDQHITAPSVVFSVTDTGTGVKPEDKDRLFNKFIRGQGSQLINTGGTGLGLYVGRMMVEAHGGNIWVESPGEGKGSTFSFSVPITPVPGTADKRLNPPPEVAAPAKAL